MTASTRSERRSRPLAYLARDLSAACGIGALLVTAQGNAQEATEGSAESVQPVVIQEIVVTAQKREQSQQDIPVAINVLTSETMEQMRIVNSRDIVAFTPSMSWSSTFSESTPNIYLRGVGSGHFRSTAGSPIGIYSDHVFIGTNLAHGFQLFDMERVEILKGPQGTLYGKNTTAGLVNFITRKPVVGGPVDGYLGVSVGRFDESIIDGAVGVPLGETTAARLAFQSRKSDGAFTNSNPASPLERTGGVDQFAWRAQLAFEPNDALDTVLKVQYVNTDNEGKPLKNVGVLGPDCPESPAIGDPRCSDIRGIVYSGDYYDMQDSFRTQDAIEMLTSMLTAEYTINDRYKLTSVTGLLDGERKASRDSDMGPGEIVNASYQDDVREFSQELRISSTTDRLSWLAGLYYFRSEYRSFQGLPAPDDPNGFWVGTGTPDGSGVKQFMDTESYAVMLDGTLRLTDRLQLTSGARWTYDERDVVASAFMYDVSGLRHVQHGLDVALDRLLFYTVPEGRYRQDWSAWSGRLILDYSISDDVMVWGGVSRGFKGGEFNIGLFASVVPDLSDPEYVTSFEAGIKSRLLGGKMLFNASAFVYDYEDMHMLVVGPADPNDPSTPNVTRQTNAGAATIRGVEAELTYRPTERWYLYAQVGWLDAEFDEFKTSVAGQMVDLAGNELPRAPDLTGSVLARYTLPVPGGAVTFQGSYLYHGKEFYTETNNAREWGPSYELLGARIEYTRDDQPWSIALWGENLGNKRYYVGRSYQSSYQVLQHQIGMPRTYGISFKYSFGGGF